MTAQRSESAPRPWYKPWWKLLAAVLFWPLAFTFIIAGSDWKLKYKIGGIAILWYLALVSTYILPVPAGEVAGESTTTVTTNTPTPHP